MRLYRSRKTPIIITYHGIAPSLETPINARHIDPKTFEMQLIFIKKNCNPVSLNDLKSSPEIKGKRKVVLTFDDGYLNNLKYALPLLEKHKIPASIYITGLNQTKHNVLWSDYHDLIAQFGPKSFKILNKTYTHNGSEYKPFIDDDGKNIHSLLKEVNFDTKYQILNKIIPWEELKIRSNKPDFWSLLSDSEIKEIEKSDYIEIGSHSYFHNNLSNITLAEAFNELLDSKKYLEQLLGKSINSVAYPDGSYTREIIEYSDKIGFKNQLAVNYLYPEDASDTRIHYRIGFYSHQTISMQKLNIMVK